MLTILNYQLIIDQISEALSMCEQGLLVSVQLAWRSQWAPGIPRCGNKVAV